MSFNKYSKRCISKTMTWRVKIRQADRVETVLFCPCLLVWKHCCHLHFIGSYFALKCICSFGWSTVYRGALILIWTRWKLKLPFWCWPTLSADDSPILSQQCKAPFTAAVTCQTYVLECFSFFLLQGAVSGSVQASDRLMKELREIYRSQSYKTGMHRGLVWQACTHHSSLSHTHPVGSQFIIKFVLKWFVMVNIHIFSKRV